MTEPCDRRTFLRRVGAVGLAVPALPLAGCGGAEGEPEAREVLPRGPAVTRPVLLPWSGDAVRIAAPLSELPMAYVSRREMRIWVDHDYRDRVYWLLGAHISVSTGVWRIPNPEDPERSFVQPGDLEREYAEHNLLEWDPDIEPAPGDFRVVRGRRTRVRLDFTCTQVAGVDAWVGAGPLDVERCLGPGDEGCREDLVPVGEGVRYADRDCSGPGARVELVTWACVVR